LSWTPADDQAAPLQLKDVSHTYSTTAGDVPVLRGVNLAVRPGELVSLIGPSGSGKSTLLSIMGLLLSPTAGSVRIAGTESTALSAQERARLRGQYLGFVFQAFHLIEHKTVRENIAAAFLYTATRTPTQIATAVEHTLERVGLGHRADALPATLSGGEKQRCAIARALVADPPVLLCDEPTGNLDAKNSRTIMDLLSQAAREHGCSVVLVTHDDEVARSADSIYRVHDGTASVKQSA
jgi:ABC-type lipoprotein export system ATPase subunit